MALHCILLLLASLVLVLQAQPITIPTSYSVVVSSNSDDFGFTYAYKEYYDSSLQMWRTDGNGTSNIYNLATVYTLLYKKLNLSCLPLNF
jgi:hypothetical protein